MKRIYITAILLTGLALSSSAMACSNPAYCWLNGVSPDGMKTTEPAKEANAQITASSEQLPEKRGETVKTSAVSLNHTKIKLVSTR